MIISLIGMSNAGKSYWSKRFEQEQGFRRICCDDLIAQELEKQQPGLNLSDMDALASWMGMPYEFGYKERETAYLAVEERVLEEVLANTPLLFKEGSGVVTSHVVIDTTGSVIYLPDALLDRLRRVSTIVHLSTPDERLTEMTKLFFSHPKPLVWDQVFSLRSDESHEAALRRCYPELLAWRRSQYEALADVTIPYEKRHAHAYSTDDFLYDVLQHQR